MTFSKCGTVRAGKLRVSRRQDAISGLVVAIEETEKERICLPDGKIGPRQGSETSKEISRSCAGHNNCGTLVITVVMKNGGVVCRRGLSAITRKPEAKVPVHKSSVDADSPCQRRACRCVENRATTESIRESL